MPHRKATEAIYRCSYCGKIIRGPAPIQGKILSREEVAKRYPHKKVVGNISDAACDPACPPEQEAMRRHKESEP